MKIMYTLNIVVAGWIGIISISNPNAAARTIFASAYQSSEVIRLVGCLWLALALGSVCGLIRPLQFSPVFIVQLFYKATWLAVIALPAFTKSKPLPGGMAIFFLVWVFVLPFIIPWAYLFAD